MLSTFRKARRERLQQRAWTAQAERPHQLAQAAKAQQAAQAACSTRPAMPVKLTKSKIAKMLARAALATVLLLGTGMLAACGNAAGSDNTAGSSAATDSATPASQPVQLKIAFCTWIGYAPFYIAEDQGYFAKHNVKPELVIIEDESQYAAALYSNSIQGLGNVLDREVTHYASGTPETVIFAMDESSGGDGVIATAEIATVADLKGKTIGMDKASTAYFFLLTILEKNGVDEADVTIQDMSADDAGTAFIAGKLDAAVVWEPFLSEASHREGGHVLVSSAEYPKTIVDVFVLRNDFIQNNPSAAADITAAWYEAIEFYKANPAKGNEIMAKGLGLKTDEVADMAAGITFFGASENKQFFTKGSTDSIFDVATRASDFWQRTGIIKKPIETDLFIATEYIGTK